MSLKVTGDARAMTEQDRSKGEEVLDTFSLNHWPAKDIIFQGENNMEG